MIENILKMAGLKPFKPLRGIAVIVLILSLCSCCLVLAIIDTSPAATTGEILNTPENESNPTATAEPLATQEPTNILEPTTTQEPIMIPTNEPEVLVNVEDLTPYENYGTGFYSPPLIIYISDGIEYLEEDMSQVGEYDIRYNVPQDSLSIRITGNSCEDLPRLISIAASAVIEREIPHGSQTEVTVQGIRIFDKSSIFTVVYDNSDDFYLEPFGDDAFFDSAGRECLE